jgi:5,10-methylene-tetrahydrofolate dehydrogenase/Methenyl tetrahydrofolate cyclohydrolase
MILLDGKAASQAVKKEIKSDVESLRSKGVIPGLAVVLVGDNPASAVYVANKEKDAKEVCINSTIIRFPAEVSEAVLINAIYELNRDEQIDGIIVQLPLPKKFDEKMMIPLIAPEKDVDGLTPVSAGRLAVGLKSFLPCTPAGVIELLKIYGVPISGMRAVIVGRSNIVGKPLVPLLLKEDATVTICHSKTSNLKAVALEADILIAAAGRPKLITADMVKEGATVVDVGINRIGDKLAGDVDFENVAPKCSFISPVPGGIGLMTRAMLLRNTVEACRLRHKA